MSLVLPRPMIPKHWSLNLPMMMGHLKRASGGHLLRTDSTHLTRACGCWCDDIPISATFSGATGCLDWMNGTFALTPNADPEICDAGYYDSYTLSANPCLDANTCYYDPGVSQWLWWLSALQVGASFKRTDVGLSVGITAYTYAMNWDGATCTYRSPTLQVSERVFYRPECTTGAFSVYSSTVAEVYIGTLPTSCSVAF